MKRFERQAEPDFWGAYERRWLYETTGPTVDPLAWKHRRRTLAQHFHERVRAAHEPRRCAYCDGPLGVESPATIDHFLGKESSRALTLWWNNLYPACVQCNSGHKGRRGSCVLVRPDVDPVDAWFDFHEETGRIAPAPELDRRTRARVRLTIRVLGLNTTARCDQRRRLLRELQVRWNAGDLEYVKEALVQGPYRFVAERFRASRKRFGALL